MNLVLALLIYMIYSNLLSIMQAWIAQSRVSFRASACACTSLMLVVLVTLFYRRLSVVSLRRLFR